jgi:hypothetical protein
MPRNTEKAPNFSLAILVRNCCLDQGETQMPTKRRERSGRLFAASGVGQTRSAGSFWPLNLFSFSFHLSLDCHTFFHYTISLYKFAETNLPPRVEFGLFDYTFSITWLRTLHAFTSYKKRITPYTVPHHVL